MALSRDHIRLLYKLRNAKFIGNGKTPSILEIGEQNWFGDVDPVSVFNISPLNEARYKDNANEVVELWQNKNKRYRFDIAYKFYESIFDMVEYTAIDMHGTQRSQNVDLNHDVGLTQSYSVVTNFGTTEHIFNQAAVYKTIHDATERGGLMLHFLPNQGQYDHGFYNYHPTFFMDLASANHYTTMILTLVEVDELGGSIFSDISTREKYSEIISQRSIHPQSAIMCVYRKDKAIGFTIPQQGVYGSERANLNENWKKTSIAYTREKPGG